MASVESYFSLLNYLAKGARGIEMFVFWSFPSNNYFGAQNNDSGSWKIIFLALMPFIFTTLQLGDLEDFLDFIPLLFLSLFVTRNQVSDYLTRMHPSLAVMMAFTIPSLLSLILPFFYKDPNFLAFENIDDTPLKLRSSLKNIKHAEGLVNTERSNFVLIFDLFLAFIGVFSTLAASTFFFVDIQTLLTYFPDRVNFVLLRVLEALDLKISNIPIGKLPTTKKLYEEIRTSSYNVTEQDLLIERSPYVVCSVCLDNMTLNEKVVKLGCKHIFHHTCLLTWLKKHCACPNCRFELPTDSIIYEYQRLRRRPVTDRYYYCK